MASREASTPAGGEEEKKTKYKKGKRSITSQYEVTLTMFSIR